jgi:hypothetical protein
MKTILTIFVVLLFLFGLPCLIGKGYAPIVGAILITGGILLMAGIAILDKLNDMTAALTFNQATERRG